MFSSKLNLGSIALVLAICTPAFAQNGLMSSGGMQPVGMTMAKSQMASMNRCKKMSHHMMTKTRTCMDLIKMHTNMMSQGSMINVGKKN